MEVKFLFDGLRGTRGHMSSKDMLLPLLKEFPQEVSVHLFRSPALRGLKSYLPERLNEVAGVSHIKAFVFDDDLILSGYG